MAQYSIPENGGRRRKNSRLQLLDSFWGLSKTPEIEGGIQKRPQKDQIVRD